MPTRLVPPEGLVCHPAGSGIVFADGHAMVEDANRQWWLADADKHQLPRLLAQGWKEWEPPKPEPVYRDEHHKEAVERPLASARFSIWPKLSVLAFGSTTASYGCAAHRRRG